MGDKRGKSGQGILSSVPNLFYNTGMLLGLTVITDAYEEETVGVVRQFGGILFTMNLFNGGIGMAVNLQFHNDGGLVHVFSRNEHQVREALACR